MGRAAPSRGPPINPTIAPHTIISPTPFRDGTAQLKMEFGRQ